MWQSWKEPVEKTTSNDPKHRSSSDSGETDSGFLSAGNIAYSTKEEGEKSRGDTEGTSELKDPKNRDDVAVTSDDQMRADSGIEVGLSDNFSQLTLKSVTLNPLGGKVQPEPIIELSPLTDHSQHEESSHVRPGQPEHKNNIRELWQLYYSQDDDGDTQLHIAIIQGFHEVALSLIRMAPHPVLLDSLNQRRQSPLHLAVFTHQPTIARRLILAGANPSLRNSDGNTALHLAAISGDLACAKALTDPLLLTERKYLTSGIQAPGIPQDLEERNYEGETCLHAAVIAGNTELVRFLVRIGSDVEAKERLGGRTALHLAIELRRTSVTNLLLQECRPRLDALTYAGITAYQIAACWDSQLAKELIKHGATPHPLPGTEYKNNDGLMLMSQPWQSVGLRA